MKTSEKKSKKGVAKLIDNYMKENFSEENRATLIVYQVLTCIVIAVLIAQIIRGNYENCFTCALTLILFLMPNFLEKKLKVTLPQTFEIIIILFIFSAQILGEMRAFYLKIPWWDTMLHTMNGFLMAAIGFSMVDILNNNDNFKFHLSPLFMAVVSFCFSMTIGVMWEFFEFAADLFLHMDMQKDTILSAFSSVSFNDDALNIPVRIEGVEKIIMSGSGMTVGGVPTQEYTTLGGYLDIGLYDTMNDMLVNFLGAVIFSIFGYFYVKNRGKGFAGRFIPKRKRDDAN